MPDKRRVFISYAWRDGRAVAEWLYKRFNATEGFSAWMDLKLHADTVFTHTLQMHLDDCDLVVCVVSPDVNRRETPSFVQKELLYATDPDVKKPVYAARAHNCHLPLIIQGYTYTDFFPDTIYEAAFAKLVAQIDKGIPPPAHSRRERELEYLREVARLHSFWGKVFVDPSAEAKIMPKVDATSVGDPDVFAFLSEVAAAVYGDKGYSRDEDSRAKVETFGALSDALGRFERVAIIGDPGSGKTTTLKRFAYRLAEDAAHNETQPLPVFVPLGGFEGGALDAYIEAQLGGLPLHDYLPDRLVVLLDGLNETAFENVKQVAAWLERNPKARVMLTCRKLDYVERKLDLQRVDVLPLDMERVLAFMTAYSLSESAREKLFTGLAGAEVNEIWSIWQREGNRFRDFWFGDGIAGSTTGTQDNRLKEIRAKMREDTAYPGLLGLVRNPFLLTMTIAIFMRENVVPHNRAQLFDGFVRQMWEKRGKPAALKRPPWIDEAVQRRALMALAYQMQWQNKGTLVETAWARGVIADAAPGHDADHLLYLLASAGILDMSSTTIKFTHQLLQEYFAAFEMGEDIRRGVPAAKYFPGDEWWKPIGWEETAILLAGMEGDSTRVVEWLTPVQPTLAYRCALESGVPCSEKALDSLCEPSPDPALRRDPMACAEGGRRMAQRGDYRPGLGLRADGLPDLVWCPVPAGKFIFGEGHELDISYEYAIAKYPVTYAQYEAFVSSDGYTNDAYWTEAGREWRGDKRQPERFWSDPQWHIANHPVVGVTWYESYAFCQWLSAKTEQEIRLPTEAEWEKAARGKNGLIYPYGNTFDPSKGNTSESGIGRTSAVGIFPGGASPYGAQDMSGNVWEWCLTQWSQEYRYPEDNTPEGKSVRVVRGGSWDSSRVNARAVFRDVRFPSFRYYNQGVRVVLSSPIP